MRKVGNIHGAIELVDKACYCGYDAPALYFSYAIAYRKLKDYDNEIIDDPQNLKSVNTFYGKL